MESYFLVSLVLALINLQACFRVARVVRESRARRWRFYLLIWFVPFYGAVFTQAELRNEGPAARQSLQEFGVSTIAQQAAYWNNKRDS
ncbi:MAG: hypothetical protein AAAFM81_11030 [Pseudomonadota bacterium]